MKQTMLDKDWEKTERILIFQGNKTPPRDASITIVIDVLRAFAVSHYAFLQGAKRIFLADTTGDAWQLKKENPACLLAGEENGNRIEGFDFDNSPYAISQHNLHGKTLVQRTTNGVRATLNCLRSKHLYVTGFTNAKNTAIYVKRQIANEQKKEINIVASHPHGDDDLACAKYIKSIIEGSNPISAEEVTERIKCSGMAEKYLYGNDESKREDFFKCMRELDSDFVMKVNKNEKTPMIERVPL